MDRRSFLKSASAAVAAGVVVTPEMLAADTGQFKTKHLIWIINGNGARKMEYFEDPQTSPNIVAMAKEGSVMTEDRNNMVNNHGYQFTELLTGIDVVADAPFFPTLPHYVRKVHGDKATNYWYLNPVSYFRQWNFHAKYMVAHPDFQENTRPVSMTVQNFLYEGNKIPPTDVVAKQFPDMGLTAAEKKQMADFIEGMLKSGDYFQPKMKHPWIGRSPFREEGQAIYIIPRIMQEFKPKMLLFQQIGHDTGHGAGGYVRDETGWFEYHRTAESTDEAVGYLWNWIKNDPYFSKNTALVIRPECGRDDEVNFYGEIHHSDGYYQAHSNASIWWGPDFKKTYQTKEIVNRMDIVPTLARIFGVGDTFAKGHLRPQIFASHAGKLPDYVPLSGPVYELQRAEP